MDVMILKSFETKIIIRKVFFGRFEGRFMESSKCESELLDV